MNTDIKIVIYGQIENDTKIGFTYPDSFDPSHSSAQDVWLRSITDLRDAVRPFNSKETFAYWKNELGNYYAIIIPAIRDEKNPFFEGGDRHGVLMLTVFTGKKIISSGQAVIDALRKLKESLMINGEVDNKELIEEIIKTIRISLSSDYYTNEKSKSNMKAFRSFSTEQELALILGQPNQAAYDEYKRIFVVPKNAIPLQQISGYKEITSPIKKTYTLDGNLPNGVFVDKKYVRDGDTITITYTKDSYLPQIESVIVDGKSNGKITYSESKFSINDATQAGIRFRRGIKIYCYSGNVGMSNYYVKYKGKQYDAKADNNLEFNDESDCYKVKIGASGFKETEVTITSDDMRNGSKKVVLVPQEKQIKILIDTSDSIIYDFVTIKGNSPLYPYLYEASINNRPINKKSKGSSSSNNGKKSDDQSFGSKIKKYIKWSSIVLFILYISYMFICACKNEIPAPFKKSVDSIPKEEKLIFSNDENQYQKEDITYLKNCDQWEKSSIKSEKFQRLFDFIQAGQIEEILKENWFESVDHNGYWSDPDSNNGIYECIKIIHDQIPERQEEAVSLLKNNIHDGKLQLSNLKKQLNEIIKDNNLEFENRGSTEDNSMDAYSNSQLQNSIVPKQEKKHNKEKEKSTQKTVNKETEKQSPKKDPVSNKTKKEQTDDKSSPSVGRTRSH